MADFKVQLELTFKSEEDMQKVIDACEPLFSKANPIIKSEILRAAQDEFNMRIFDATSIIPKMYTTQIEAGALVVEIRKSLEKSQDELKEAKELVQKVEGYQKLGNNRIIAIQEFVQKLSDEVKKQEKNYNQFVDETKKAEALRDALAIINDALQIGSILTNGSVTLLEKDKVSRKWEYKR